MASPRISVWSSVHIFFSGTDLGNTLVDLFHIGHTHTSLSPEGVFVPFVVYSLWLTFLGLNNFISDIWKTVLCIATPSL